MEKLPPQSKEVEQSLLTSIFLDKDNINKIKILPEYFYFKAHEKIFFCMLELSQNGNNIDLITLSEQLGEHIKDVGGRSYLVTLANGIGGNPEKYAEIIKDKYLKREAIKRCSEVMDKMYEEKEYSKSIEPLKKLLFTANEKYTINTNPLMAGKWYEEYGVVETIKYKTGLPELDKVIGGLSGTELMLILANTNIGKTTFLLNMAVNLILEGKKVLFFSLEMSEKQLNNKIISILGKHDAMKIRTGEYEKEMLWETTEKYKKLPLTIIDKGSITTQDVMSEIYKRKINGDVDIVMIDYIQRLSDSGWDSETMRIGHMARTLKNFALTYQVPIISPAQMDKASAKSNSTDVISVAWSKDLANEADIALTLVEKTEEKKSITEEPEKKLWLTISKSRDSEKDKWFEIDFDRKTLKMQIIERIIIK